MSIEKFIKSHRELAELPFLVVFRTILFLKQKGMISMFGDSDVDKV